MLITRRSFLSLPFFASLAERCYSFSSNERVFKYDHILGTSLDLAVWTSSPSTAARIHDAVLEEIDRLTAILNTRDPNSEISRLDKVEAFASTDLQNVLNAYALWEKRTKGILSIHPTGLNSPRNVDALGKAFILDRAAQAARNTAQSVDGILLNIGGDITTWGKAVEIAIANPSSPYDNAEPLTRIIVQNCAIATSGGYARGAHLLDARSGQPAPANRATTVIAPDAVTANAIATTMCIAGTTIGFPLLNLAPNTQALYVDEKGIHRSPGFAAMERPIARRISTAAAWPQGYQLTIPLTLTSGAQSRNRRGSGKRPYVAVWVEDPNGKLVRVLAFWASKDNYYPDLSRFWNVPGSNKLSFLHSYARATRPPGKYDLVWDGLDEKHNPVPTGTYRIIVETNQEHGQYGKQEATINLGDSPTTVTLPATTNFEAVPIQYGPKSNPA
jgi:thiamine biosynthesis lipoprotein ApbE